MRNSKLRRGWIRVIAIVGAGLFGVAAGGGEALPSGDINGDGKRDIADAVRLLSYLFAEGVVPVACGPCPPADMPPPWQSLRASGAGTGDVNGDGVLNVADPIALLAYLFAAGTAPQSCGVCWACGSRRLPSTGELYCLDTDTATIIDCNDPEWPGQDAFYAMGCPLEGRFIDNGDGTVTDLCTNLMWRKETARPEWSEIYDYVTGWEDALRYAEDLEFAGYDDWRLPNINELSSLSVWREPPLNQQVDERTHIPEPFDIPTWTWPSSSYWSSSCGFTVASVYGGILVVNCRDGPPAYGAHTRCVRGGLDVCESRLPATGLRVCLEPDWSTGGVKVVSPEATTYVGQDAVYGAGCPMEGRFIDNADGTVTDLCTGLMWQRDPAVPDASYDPDECGGIWWHQALGYAESIEFAGYSDWRLPNVRELLMLGHWGFCNLSDPQFKREYPFRFGQADDDPESVCVSYWTSSPGPHGSAYAVNHWPSGKLYNRLSDTHSWKFLVRCVRGPIWIDER